MYTVLPLPTLCILAQGVSVINPALKGFNPGKFMPPIDTVCLLQLVGGQTVVATLERASPITTRWRMDTGKLPRDRGSIVQSAQVVQWTHLPGWRDWASDLL